MDTTLTAPPPAAQLRAPVGSGPNLEQLLAVYRKSFETVAPKILDVHRMLAIAVQAVSRNRALLECTGTSMIGSLMMATQLGLDIGAGEAHLVPFWNATGGKSVREAQLIPDYKGLAKLIRNTGLVTNCRSQVVYKQDVLEYEEGTHPKLIHKPNLDHEYSNEDIIGAYNVAHFANGYVEPHFVGRRYLLSVKARAKSTTGPWYANGDQRFDFAEMCKKTALKHHSKNLPRSVELAQALDLDNRAEAAAPQDITLEPDHATGTWVPAVGPEAEASAPTPAAQEYTAMGPPPEPPPLSAPDRLVQQQKKAAGPKAKPGGFPVRQGEISDDQYTELSDLIREHGWMFPQVQAWMKGRGYTSELIRNLKPADYEPLKTYLKAGPPAAEGPA